MQLPATALSQPAAAVLTGDKSNEESTSESEFQKSALSSASNQELVNAFLKTYALLNTKQRIHLIKSSQPELVHLFFKCAQLKTYFILS